jgi:GNAT superfamily N-acetyltransferase
MPQDVLDELDPATRVERVQSWFEPGHRTMTFVAVGPDGTIVAFANCGPCTAVPDDDAIGEVYAIYGHPDHWGTGAGYAVMKAALRGLAAQGRYQVRLWVLGTNERARRFYERVGFALDGQTGVFRLERGGHPPVELDEVGYVFDGRTLVA